jgi:hypothetical protein
MIFRLFPFLSPDAEPNENPANNFSTNISDEINSVGENVEPHNEVVLPEVPAIEEPIVEIPEIIFENHNSESALENGTGEIEDSLEIEVLEEEKIEIPVAEEMVTNSSEVEELVVENEPAPIEVVAETPVLEEIDAKPEVIEAVVEIPALAEKTDDTVLEKDEILAEEIEQHDELVPQIAFNELSRAELVDLLKSAVEEESLDSQKLRVQSIREAYYKVKEEEVTAKRLKFIENGGLPEEFEVMKDDTDSSFEAYVKQFQEKRSEIRKNKEKELLQNLKKKEAILDELKHLMEKTDNISASFDRLHELQAEWRTIGLVPSANVDELWKIYHHHINNFYEVIKINKELRELDHKKNIELKTQLCVRAEELLMNDSITRSLEEYKGLQDQWKDIGQVAREVSETIWERFRAAGDKLFDRRREYIQGQESEHNENLAKKIAICERADVLVNELPLKAHQHWQEASDKLAVMLEDWKKVGFASRKDNEDIWKRFKAARDKFYESKEEFYKSLRETQNHNYKLKVDLCMGAEALRDSDDWKKTGDKIRELQEQWKNSGPVAKKHSDKLWIRFRSACDVFFENRNKHFAGMNDEQGTNLEKKKDLIARIEAFVHGEDGNANFDALKAFQNEWMEIGHVPIKEKEKIQKTYRTAIDKQFDTLKATNAEGKRQNFRAQVSHFTSAPGGKDKLNHQKTTVQDKIKRLQTEVQTLENNIGFFANAKSKAADDMRRDIEKKISKAKEEIATLQDQLKILKEPS